MAELKNITIGALTVALLISLGFAVQPDDSHFCRALEISKSCDRLSLTEKTCYPAPATTIGKKYCSSGWEEILVVDAQKIISDSSGAVKELCPVGAPCVPIK